MNQNQHIVHVNGGHGQAHEHAHLHNQIHPNIANLQITHEIADIKRDIDFLRALYGALSRENDDLRRELRFVRQRLFQHTGQVDDGAIWNGYT